MTEQGDIVLLDFPFSAGGASVVRPAVVVQRSDRNAVMEDTIVAMVTSQVRESVGPGEMILDPGLPGNDHLGLRVRSMIKCGKLFTVSQSKILRKLGQLSVSQMDEMKMALRFVFDV